MSLLLTSLAPLLLLSSAAHADGPIASTAAKPPLVQDEEQQRDLSHFNLGKDNLALQGYDPVAYFEEGGGKPRKGSKELTLRYRGVLYRFESAKHRELFKANPARFEPTYGGWCAYAMAQESEVEIDPESFLVTNGELKLFYKSFFNDTRKKWIKASDELEPKAKAYWKQLTEQQ